MLHRHPITTIDECHEPPPHVCPTSFSSQQKETWVGQFVVCWLSVNHKATKLTRYGRQHSLLLPRPPSLPFLFLGCNRAGRDTYLRLCSSHLHQCHSSALLKNVVGWGHQWLTDLFMLKGNDRERGGRGRRRVERRRESKLLTLGRLR